MNSPFRIGMGYDVHSFASGRELWLGGVQIPHTSGLEGHSDADVILHAICDALLGALALDDIGIHFPNTSEAFRNIDSKELLTHCTELIHSKGFRVGNVDVSVAAEAPKLAPHLPAMRAATAACLLIDTDCVSIKATTNEGMGFVGREEGIAAWAVALLFRA